MHVGIQFSQNWKISLEIHFMQLCNFVLFEMILGINDFVNRLWS